MGYDLFGIKPTSPAGEYFGRSIFCWPPLAGLCLDLARRETFFCRDWFEMDGDGLNAKRSVKLALRLERLLADGAVTRYLTAVRKTNYEGVHRIDESDVCDFIAFLKDCGGFRIC
jgi:hypothetical protein